MKHWLFSSVKLSYAYILMWLGRQPICVIAMSFQSIALRYI